MCHFPLSRSDENHLLVGWLAVVPKRVPGATNGGNLSPTASIISGTAIFPSSRSKGRILALVKSAFLTFAWKERLFIIAVRPVTQDGWHGQDIHEQST